MTAVFFFSADRAGRRAGFGAIGPAAERGVTALGPERGVTALFFSGRSGRPAGTGVTALASEEVLRALDATALSEIFFRRILELNS